VAAALRAEKTDPNPTPAGVLGAAAAFVFAAQMINVPVAPGTSGHLVGAALAAVLLGPWRALIVMTVVLTVQALLFQDGGITALGANLADMGIAGVLAGYATAALAARWMKSPRGFVVGGVLGAFVATLAAAALTALWLSLSGLYPLAPILQLLLVTHIAIGLLEAALTGAVLATLVRWRPDLIRGISANGRVSSVGALASGVLAIAMVVAAFVSPFASALPDGLERVAATLGFAGRARAGWAAPFPDYGIPFAASPALATAIAGMLGTAAVSVVAWAVSRGLKKAPRDDVHG
ncbi:MAG: energy-coupling factor ABC transporter permease, partial [Acidobacteria bacterium]|nr:energy-coupling factor ABC transporter permease [Acidobacteriota bacterium]